MVYNDLLFIDDVAYDIRPSSFVQVYDETSSVNYQLNKTMNSSAILLVNKKQTLAEEAEAARRNIRKQVWEADFTENSIMSKYMFDHLLQLYNSQQGFWIQFDAEMSRCWGNLHTVGKDYRAYFTPTWPIVPYGHEPGDEIDFSKDVFKNGSRYNGDFTVYPEWGMVYFPVANTHSKNSILVMRYTWRAYVRVMDLQFTQLAYFGNEYYSGRVKFQQLPMPEINSVVWNGWPFNRCSPLSSDQQVDVGIVLDSSIEGTLLSPIKEATMASRIAIYGLPFGIRGSLIGSNQKTATAVNSVTFAGEANAANTGIVLGTTIGSISLNSEVVETDINTTYVGQSIGSVTLGGNINAYKTVSGLFKYGGVSGNVVLDVDVNNIICNVDYSPTSDFQKWPTMPPSAYAFNYQVVEKDSGDENYVYNDGTAVGDFAVNLNMPDPGFNTGMQVNVRVSQHYELVPLYEAYTFVVTLKQGATNIASWSTVTTHYGFKTYSYYLTSAQMAAITDYSQLRIQVSLSTIKISEIYVNVNCPGAVVSKEGEVSGTIVINGNALAVGIFPVELD